MIWLEIDEVYELHELIIKRADTKALVRDFTLLHSAVERPKATFDGKYLYPTIFAKAGALLQSICLNHPFSDGNKRTAYAATARFLYLNGWKLVVNRKEGADFMVYVDNHKPDLIEIARWLKTHCQKI